MRARVPICAAILAGALAGACQTPEPPIGWAPYGEGYAAKPDFARVEKLYPLTPAQRANVTPQSLARLSQEQFDQLYARLTAGPLPDGPYQGTVILAAGGGLRRLPEILGGAKGFAPKLGIDGLQSVAEMLWKGKVFDRDRREVRNVIQHPRALAKLLDADVSVMRSATFFGSKVGLLFPAKLYCGQSLLDSRRESVIVDAAFGDEIDGYLPAVDALAGRDGLQIRDELRLIRPGLYLGRAYAARIFLLDFILYNPEVAARGQAAFVRTGEVEQSCR